MGHVGVVLIGHESPVLLCPIRVELALTHLPLVVGRHPLQRPQVLDRTIGVQSVRPDPEQSGAARVDGTHHIGKEVDIVGAEELLIRQVTHVAPLAPQHLHPKLVVHVHCRLAFGEWLVLQLLDPLAFLLEEQATELVEHDSEQLALVIVPRLQSQPGTGSDLPLDLSHVPHVVVLAEWSVPNRRVVGPSEQLWVGALDVVALVEGVKDGLPVGRKDHRSVGPEPHLLEAVGLEEPRQGTEERLE